MTDTIRTINQNIPQLGRPDIIKADFAQWNLADGYVMWIKQLSGDDLLDDPFYDHTTGDIGSFKIAIELSPED